MENFCIIRSYKASYETLRDLRPERGLLPPHVKIIVQADWTVNISEMHPRGNLSSEVTLSYPNTCRRQKLLGCSKFTCLFIALGVT